MCMIDECDAWTTYFPPRVYRTRYERRCDECGRTIPVGEQYHYEGGVIEGHIDMFATCLHCAAAREFLRAECGGWVFYAVRDELEEHWHEDVLYRTIWLGRCIHGMRRKWQRRDGTMMPVPAPYSTALAPVAA